VGLFAFLADTAPTVTDVLGWVRDGGVIGILVFFIVGFWRQWWVMGWQWEACQRDRDEWRQMALRGTDLAERLSTTVGRSRQPKQRSG
jgi:uncharacterized membrane protein